MKSILISIKPEWVEKILNGKKTVEIRKTIPKCKLPCKVYIYCSKSKNKYLNRKDGWLCFTEDRDILGISGNIRKYTNNVDGIYERLNGLVVAEFMLDKIECFTTDYRKDAMQTLRILNCACVDYDDASNYEKNSHCLYAWHIKDLFMYDKPKELSDFKKENKCHYADYEKGCCFENCTFYDLKDCDGKYSKIYNAPQSWCYVEEI